MPLKSLLVIEYCTSGAGRLAYDDEGGGGGGAVGEELDPEGFAMAVALAEDGAAIPGCEVTVAVDGNLRKSARAKRLRAAGAKLKYLDEPDQESDLYEDAESYDAVILVAPEIGDQLFERTTWLGRAKRLGAGLECIELASDKQQLADHLHRAGVPAPRGLELRHDAPWPAELVPLPPRGKKDAPLQTPLRWPVVAKPVCGCGSLDVKLLPSAEAAAKQWSEGGFSARVEEYHPGLPVSVSFLVGPKQTIALPPCLQMLSEDGSFTYLGGLAPIDPPLAERATQLASRAVAALPKAGGWIGVDLVLGADPTGAEDVVIEVNPRLTTSYIGLRKLVAPTNLVEAMWKLQYGRKPLPPFAVPLRDPIVWEFKEKKK